MGLVDVSVTAHESVHSGLNSCQISIDKCGLFIQPCHDYHVSLVSQIDIERLLPLGTAVRCLSPDIQAL